MKEITKYGCVTLKRFSSEMRDLLLLNGTEGLIAKEYRLGAEEGT